MKFPTAKEIRNARAVTVQPTSDALGVMEDWKGAGWHRTEVLYGILIGLKIAERREKLSGNAPHKDVLTRVHHKPEDAS